MPLTLSEIAEWMAKGYTVGFHPSGEVSSLTPPGQTPPSLVYQTCDGKKHRKTRLPNDIVSASQEQPESADPRHKQFITAFTEAWSEHMEGEKYDMSNCGRDTKALSLFFKRNDKTVDELMLGVRWAWGVLASDGQHAAGCVKACMTIHGFIENYNALRTFYASYKNKSR